MKLKDLIKQFDVNFLSEECVNYQVNSYEFETYSDYSLKNLQVGYKSAIEEMLICEPKKAKYDLIIDFDNDDFCFLNKKYEKPKEKLKAWGGDGKETNIPEGYYDANCDKYNKFFSISFCPWGEVLNSSISNLNQEKLLESAVLAVFRITFDGFSEEAMIQSEKEIMKRLEDSKNSEGICIEDFKKYIENL